MAEKLQNSELESFRPSDFMRARRPYLFSDTQVVGQPLLDRNFLEYHLEKLTSRSQEKDFEYFCRKLAEKELCPNLLPQTGPTGGGDSKVDSETYPVSDAVSLRWYEGVGREAALERWAFAISAKQQWRSKVRSDVQGIVETQRGYTLIYFISSQYIKDKDRANVEDELRKKYSINVRILDRTWILDKVFENKREYIAIETLKINSSLTQVVKKGSLDTAREAELNELEAQIQDHTRYQGVEYQLVEDCLEAVILSRELELPRVEVDGRLARAERIAEQYGTYQQKLRCAYANAWTAYWWYDDFYTLNRIYDEVERLAIGSNQATDIELLGNLLFLLRTTVMMSHLEATVAKLDERTVTLRTELRRLQSEQNRPSNALHARANELLMDLNEIMTNLKESTQDSLKLQKIFEEFQEVFTASKSLVNFPIDSLIDIFMNLGESFTDNSNFDELFECVLSVSQKRESMASSGGMLLKRGEQKLRSGKFYEAIRLLGRAQKDLAIYECHSELIATLALCASAYEAAGLLWAAHANMIAATSLALNEFWKKGKITVQALACLQRLIWIELQLGRIPITLSWIVTASVIAATLILDDELQEKFLEERQNQDLVLGILLLQTEFHDLKHLGFIPQVLDKLSLPSSYVASLYALGYEDTLRSEGWIPQEESALNTYEFFRNWVTQYASNDLLKTPEFLLKPEIEISSQVLGCNIIAKVPNNNSPIFLAESIFAALESFLATSLDAKIYPHQSNFQLQLVPSCFISHPIDFHIKYDTGKPFIEVKYHEDKLDISNPELKKIFRDKLVELIFEIIIQIAFIPNLEEFFEILVKDELGLSRALNFTDIATGFENILGDELNIRLSDWQLEDSTNMLAVRRTNRWDNEIVEHVAGEKSDLVSPKPGEGEVPAELKNIYNLKHRDRKIFSLFNVNLWNQAGWSATGFGAIPHPSNLPALMLLFKNEDASKNIFIQWQKEIGTEDVEEKLRISIITGIDADNPAAYRMVIGMNPNWLDTANEAKGSQYISMSRIHTMNPRDSKNLDQFLSAFEKVKAYVLAPGYVSQDYLSTDVFIELGILKHQIIVRPAWQIGEHDLDICGLQTDDKVIIPKDVKDPPVVSALTRLRKQKNR